MKPLRFSMSMREENEREAENQAGDECGKPLEESIEHAVLILLWNSREGQIGSSVSRSQLLFK